MKQNYRIVSLYSGSGGNSTFIRIGDIALLIDAGKSARALCRALTDIGESIENISAIFITVIIFSIFYAYTKNIRKLNI